MAPTGPHAVAERRARARLADDDDRRLRRAALLHLDGDLDEAERRYRAVLADEPEHPAAVNNLALLVCQRGDHDEAIELLGRLGPPDALSPTALGNLALAHLGAGDTTTGIGLLERAVTVDPDGGAWLALARARLAADQRGPAEVALRQWLDRHEPRADVLCLYGSCLAARGALDHAAAVLADAVRLDDTSAAAWLQLGAVSLARHDAGSAVAANRRAVALAAGAVDARRQLAVSLVAVGAVDEAAAQLDSVLAAARSSDVLVDRAVLWLTAGRPDQAELLLLEAASDDATGRAQVHLAYCLLAQDQVPAATSLLQEVAASDVAYASAARTALTTVKSKPVGSGAIDGDC